MLSVRKFFDTFLLHVGVPNMACKNCMHVRGLVSCVWLQCFLGMLRGDILWCVTWSLLIYGCWRSSLRTIPYAGHLDWMRSCKNGPVVLKLKRYIHMHFILVHKHPMAVAPFLSWRGWFADHTLCEDLRARSLIDWMGLSDGAAVFKRPIFDLVCCRSVGNNARVHCHDGSSGLIPVEFFHRYGVLISFYLRSILGFRLC